MKKRTSPGGKSEKAAKPAKEPVSPSKALRIPSILLEGDEPMPFRTPEAAQKQAPGRQACAEPPTEPSALPEAYGTGRLLLVARDPHSLYVHWDLAPEQQSHYQTLALNRHLNLRVYREAVEGQVLKEVQASRDSQHSFIHVEGAGGKYVVELGYYPRSGRWVSLAVSAPVETPPVSLAPEAAVQFAAMPSEVPRVQLPGAAPGEAIADATKERRAPAALETLKRLALPTIAWLPGLEPGGAPATPVAELVRRTLPQLQAQPPVAAPGWSPAQERCFAEVLRLVERHQDYANSLALAESVLVQLRRGAAPSVEAELPFPEWLRVPEGISSPSGGEQAAPRGFWFNVYAELVIYGATEPEARVTIGGKAIQLRPDGTFSLRFALPDGNYELAAAATSAQGDSRQARLAFSRHTEYQGQVGTAPGDSSLKPIS